MFVEKAPSAIKKDNFEKQALAKTLKQIIGPVANGLFGFQGALALTVLSATPAAATLPASLQIVPDTGGNTNHCDGLYYCNQPAVKNIDTDQFVASFMETVGLTDSSEGSAATELAFQKCLKEKDFMSKLINSVVSDAATDLKPGAITSATGPVWSYTQATVTAYGLDPSKNAQFQGAATALFTECQTLATTGQAVLNTGAIIGITFACLAVCCCLIAGANAVYNRKSLSEACDDNMKCLSVVCGK